MDAHFQLNADSIPVPVPGTKVIKASDYARFIEARDIVAAAKAEAERIKADAQEEYARRSEEGYRDGLEAGKMENAEKMLETVLASVEFIESVETSVVNVVNQSVKKIIGELDEKDRICRLVHTALQNVRGQQKVIVRIAPADEEAVASTLAAMTSGSFINLLCDGRLAPGSCILESSLGVVDASLETQLAALEHAFTSKIHQ